MKQFASILFVLFFALATSSQSQNIFHKEIGCNSVFLENGSSTGQNPLLFHDDYFDVPDTNDLDDFDCILFVPTSFFIHQDFEYKSVPAIISRVQSVEVDELLLDLPPPVLSI